MKRCSGLVMCTLESLAFDNAALRDLPIDATHDHVPRQVRNACFSRVKPTQLANPSTVTFSASAMRLLGLGEEELEREEFAKYFSGSKHIPGDLWEIFFHHQICQL